MPIQRGKIATTQRTAGTIKGPTSISVEQANANAYYLEKHPQPLRGPAAGSEIANNSRMKKL